MQLALPKAPRDTTAPGDWSAKNLALLALLSAFAFLLMGYHTGLEDDSFYLAAIKRNLNPALFSHDSDFFRIQFQATIFDKLVAFSARLTHLPLAWVILLWQIAAIFFLLHGCWRISRRCFTRPEAQWAGTAMVAVLLTLPVAGIAINSWISICTRVLWRLSQSWPRSSRSWIAASGSPQFSSFWLCRSTP